MRWLQVFKAQLDGKTDVAVKVLQAKGGLEGKDLQVRLGFYPAAALCLCVCRCQGGSAAELAAHHQARSECCEAVSSTAGQLPKALNETFHVQAFLTEVAVLFTCQHECIVAFFGAYLGCDHAYLVQVQTGSALCLCTTTMPALHRVATAQTVLQAAVDKHLLACSA